MSQYVLSWVSGSLSIHDCMSKVKQKQPQDRKTIFETLSLPVAKILSPVARQAPTKLWKGIEISREIVRKNLHKGSRLLVQGVQGVQGKCVGSISIWHALQNHRLYRSLVHYGNLLRDQFGQTGF